VREDSPQPLSVVQFGLADQPVDNISRRLLIPSQTVDLVLPAYDAKA
jgi:hypothetical protein